ncbi:NAD(P)H-dependent oxidoreductase [Tardiphaga sp. 215_C5_N2_1]|jgi:NAD(P)H dehydrogenase (quinone)|uniref:NAD(P)H-dependent oxidoreductase n=1 Tax=unclassified Tardiphaga TaxID=2631404 RepID=UPI001E65AA0A|nr:NAD(P)H-dependent oxidoreductase [Tardiphaga sp. 37S4]UFS76331.1 NAD(P)H-dependent oxidoreductase [Tardiphaga sp. 37S4]
MNVLMIYAHPEPTSFTGALKDAGVATLRQAGHAVVVSDLYAERFDPVAGRHDFNAVADAGRFHYQTEQAHAHGTGGFAADLVREQQRLRDADLVVWLYPIWWGGMPAILKGWFDRVLAFGFAYADGRRFDSGFFPDKRGLLCLSTGGTRQRFSAGDAYGDIQTVLWPAQRLMIEYLGMTALEPFVAYAAPRVDAEGREVYLRQWSLRLQKAVEDMAPHAGIAVVTPTERGRS